MPIKIIILNLFINLIIIIKVCNFCVDKNSPYAIINMKTNLKDKNR